ASMPVSVRLVRKKGESKRLGEALPRAECACELFLVVENMSLCQSGDENSRCGLMTVLDLISEANEELDVLPPGTGRRPFLLYASLEPPGLRFAGNSDEPLLLGVAVPIPDVLSVAEHFCMKQ